jgi:hypothetical protein
VAELDEAPATASTKPVGPQTKVCGRRPVPDVLGEHGASSRPVGPCQPAGAERL